jgi:hypothetical protein
VGLSLGKLEVMLIERFLVEVSIDVIAEQISEGVMPCIQAEIDEYWSY